MLLPALALLLAACTVAQPSPSVPTGPALDGRTFLSTSVTDGGAPRQLVPGTRIRIGFTGGGLSASAGCNQMGGAYRLEGNRLVVDSLATTDMACDPPLMEQDAWLARLLAGRPAVILAGDNLTLERDGTALVLLDRRVADPDRPLAGPTWRVESLIKGQAVQSVPSEVTATLTFGADGLVKIDTGCNTGDGRYTTDQGSLQISGIGLTKRACSGPAGALEQAVLAVLRSDRITWAIEARSLTLLAGGLGLGLRSE